MIKLLPLVFLFFWELAWSESMALPVYVTFKNEETKIYGSITDAIEKKNPLRITPKNRMNFSLAILDTNKRKELNDLGLEMINPGEFVSLDDIEYIKVSEFSGIHIKSKSQPAFGWTRSDVFPVAAPGISSDSTNYHQKLDLNSYVEISKVKKVKRTTWYQLVDKGWVPAKSVSKFEKARRPPNISSKEKWLHISISRQIMTAYDGDKAVFATLISSGRRSKETKRGLFRIYNRLELAKMEGDPGPDYFLFEDIPFHLYFYKFQAIHGAYNRHQFGHKGSHGCINLSVSDARWVWEWTGGRKDMGSKGPKFDPKINGNYVFIED
jgi:lipoprotein-anchoring transpeptidase ErfK/SrfK